MQYSPTALKLLSLGDLSAPLHPLAWSEEEVASGVNKGGKYSGDEGEKEGGMRETGRGEVYKVGARSLRYLRTEETRKRGNANALQLEAARRRAVPIRLNKSPVASLN